MDAATLYVIVTMSDGSQTTSAQGMPSLHACTAVVELLKEVARADRSAPINGYWCVENRQTVRLSTCSRYWPRSHLESPGAQAGIDLPRAGATNRPLGKNQDGPLVIRLGARLASGLERPRARTSVSELDPRLSAP